MPARRQPTELLLLKGSFKNRPRSRLEARAGEPEVEAPLGPPPETLKAAAKKVWLETAKSAYWLRETDRGLLKVYSTFMAEFDRDPMNMMAAQVAQMIKAAIELGLSPVARTRVKAPEKKQEETNPFAQFAS